MMYVRYDTTTGKVTSFGDMGENFVSQEITEGKPIISVSQYVSGDDWSVNLETKELQNVPPLEPKE